jgi:hypothetical protein
VTQAPKLQAPQVSASRFGAQRGRVWAGPASLLWGTLNADPSLDDPAWWPGPVRISGAGRKHHRIHRHRALSSTSLSQSSRQQHQPFLCWPRRDWLRGFLCMLAGRCPRRLVPPLGKMEYPTQTPPGGRATAPNWPSGGTWVPTSPPALKFSCFFLRSPRAFPRKHPDSR